MKYIIKLKDRLTGYERDYIRDYPYEVTDLLYLWLEGNFACDCNRALFLWDWEIELPCNRDERNRRIDLIYIKELKSGKIIYEIGGKVKIIKKGELFLVTNGEYSDYGINALLKATENIYMEVEINEFLRERDREENYCFDTSGFMNWLIIRRAIAIEIKALEFWTTSYSSFMEREDNWTLGEL